MPGASVGRMMTPSTVPLDCASEGKQKTVISKPMRRRIGTARFNANLRFNSTFARKNMLATGSQLVIMPRSRLNANASGFRIS